MNEEIILDKLRKMLFTTQQANECGLSNNDFKEDIQVLSAAIELIENLIQKNKELKEKINKSIEFINNDNTFLEDGENWQNVLHIERILKGE